MECHHKKMRVRRGKERERKTTADVERLGDREDGRQKKRLVDAGTELPTFFSLTKMLKLGLF